jgi:general secretion pathway protein A
MYLDFYKLHAKPFQISTDPRFLWLGEKHKEALAVLKYGILDNKGFLLLTGDVGTGKTTLLNALIDSLEDNVLVAMVTDPGLAKMDFFNFVADSFEMNKRFKSKGDFLIYLKNYLMELHRQHRQALLIIDECQHLNQKLLEEVRLLSNIEKQHTKLINIFFVGQNEFNEIILRPRNRAIRQRITINYNIEPLSATETENYIRFRLQVAGSNEAIFTDAAINEVYSFSNGYPRLINIVCDQALLTGFVKESRRIDENMVTECANELRISQGPSIHISRATPEYLDPPPNAPKPQASEAAVATALSDNVKMNKILVIALVVVLAVWSGLVAAYFLIHDRPAAAPIAVPSPASQPTQPPDPVASVTDAPRTSENRASVDVSAPAASTATPAPPETASTAVSSAAPENTGEETGAPPSTADTITLAMIQARYGAPPEVFFGFNANTFEETAYPLLEMIAQYCLEHPETQLVLRGYSDNSGVRAYNVKLSEFRADMVKTYLVGRGVPGESIQTIAMGPIDDDATIQGSMRKVVIEIVSPQESG